MTTFWAAIAGVVIWNLIAAVWRKYGRAKWRELWWRLRFVFWWQRATGSVRLGWGASKGSWDVESDWPGLMSTPRDAVTDELSYWGE
jgi:hypothetical protein